MSQVNPSLILKIPAIVFESAHTKEDLEDWLLANDPEFAREIEKIHQEELNQGITLDEAEKKWLTNS